MGKNLGGAIIDLLESGDVGLRAAATTVLAAVGKGDATVEAALTERLGDADAGVQRLALEALASFGTTSIAARLVPLLKGGTDDELAERAAQVLAQQGAAAEGTLRKEVASGPIGARRVMAQLLLRRGTQPAIDAVLDQLPDEEFGEQALQLVRAELDRGEKSGGDKLGNQVEKSALARSAEAAKELHKLWAVAEKTAAKAAPAKKKGDKTPVVAYDPLRDSDVARAASELGALLRLIGYLARPSTQSMLLKFAVDAEEPRPIRLAAIAGLRRIVAQSEAKGTEKVIEALIDLADGDEVAVAHSAVDTLRGARIPEGLAKAFAGLAKSKNVAAQKLAMERLPAGGGASAVKALIEALGGGDPTARDAAARGLAKAPEAVMPLVKALLELKPGGASLGTAEARSDAKQRGESIETEQIARRYAGALRSHKGNVSKAAIDELADAVSDHIDRHFKNKATADSIVLERVLAELVADLAPARHVELLFDRAKRLRKAGKSIEAFGSLKPLLRSHADMDAAVDDEQRFLLALLALEAAGEGILRTTRADDPVFEQFSRLAAKGFPVAKRLAKESEVTDEAMYALGFRLLESEDGANEELGAELLQGIIDERPRSKLAKAAKNKLKLTGHSDED